MNTWSFDFCVREKKKGREVRDEKEEEEEEEEEGEEEEDEAGERRMSVLFSKV